MLEESALYTWILSALYRKDLNVIGALDKHIIENLVFINSFSFTERNILWIYIYNGVFNVFHVKPLDKLKVRFCFFPCTATSWAQYE